LNKKNALRNAFEKEITATVKKAGESKLFERMQEMHEHPDKGWTIDDEAQFAKFAHQRLSGLDACTGLEDEVVQAGVEGVSTPGL